jgi:hypothetical protein
MSSSGQDQELQQFLDALRKLTNQHVTTGRSLDDPACVAALRRALDDAGVSDLAVETSGMDGALDWLAGTVTEIALTSPSIAFVLAARYTAQRAIASACGQPEAALEATAGLVTDVPGTATGRSRDVAGQATVPFQFDPRVILFLDMEAGTGILVGRDSLTDLGEGPARRSGLADARLRLVQLTSRPLETLDAARAGAAIRDWNILTAAIAIGIAHSAITAAETYAAERQQFGSKLVSFAGIRAMLAEMYVRCAAARALLDRALHSEERSLSSSVVSVTAGRMAVDVSLDAIQIHGGYGYIEEYPVARQLRDAISVRARGGACRSIAARIASDRLGSIDWEVGA